jgi:hypothetical protein
VPSGSRQVDSVVGGTNISVDNTDPTAPVVSFDGTIPTKTSDLTNDSDFVADPNYNHTDSNYTAIEKAN